jgi:hypothetical protein
MTLPRLIGIVLLCAIVWAFVALLAIEAVRVL